MKLSKRHLHRVFDRGEPGERHVAAEYVIGTLKIFGGTIVSRKPDPMTLEIARRAIIYNAACPWPLHPSRRHVPNLTSCHVGTMARITRICRPALIGHL